MANCFFSKVNCSPNGSFSIFIQVRFLLSLYIQGIQILGFHDGSDACNSGDLGLIPGLGRSPGGGHASLCSPVLLTPFESTVSLFSVGEY